MNKKMISPILFTLGTLSISGLIAGALISNSNSISNNDNSSLTSNIKIAENRIDTPTGGIIDGDYVKKLIAFKKTIPGWDGSLVETDFVGATTVSYLAFSKITEVTSIIFPNSVHEIYFNAFLDNTSINSISALGVTSIGSNAFGGTTGLDIKGIKLTYSNSINIRSIDSWGTHIRMVHITPNKPYPEVPGGVITHTFIGELNLFKKSWTDALGEFDGTYFADEFINATSVADNAFKNSLLVKKITLPDTVTTIGTNAFQGASNLTNISALGVTNIHNGAFSAIPRISNNGIKLTYSLNIKPGNISNWGTSSIDKYSIKGSPSKPIVPSIITAEFVKELIIYKKSQVNGTWDGHLNESDFIGGSNTATTIATGAFQNNTEVTSIIFPNTVKTINTNAFNGASKLTTISALGVTTIDNNAFAGTSGIISTGIKLTYSANIKITNVTSWGTTIQKVTINNTPRSEERRVGKECRL